MKTGDDIHMLEAKARKWLSDWERLINSLDFAGARALFSKRVISFGTFAEMLIGRDDLEMRQWRKIWPEISGFTFDEPRILVSKEAPQIITVLALWRSQGTARNSGSYDRKGRATLILKAEKSGLLCIHSHLSMEPGIPPLET